MNKDLYLRRLTEKKEKIEYMHQVIRKNLLNNYITTVQYEVLLRGYIVLIYSFWEAGYKSLPEFFFKRLKYTEVNSLPVVLRNKIYDQKILSYRLGDGKNHQIIQSKYTKFENLKKARTYEIWGERLTLFGELSNNPKISHLKNVLKLYHMGLNIDSELEKKINFIIESRNDIAHAGAVIENYLNEAFNKLKIQEIITDFNNNGIKAKDKRELIIDQLQDILNSMFMKFKEIVDEFDQKYLQQKIMLWIKEDNPYEIIEKIIKKICLENDEITIFLPKLSELGILLHGDIINGSNILKLRKEKRIEVQVNGAVKKIYLKTLKSLGVIKGPCIGYNIDIEKFILHVNGNINENYFISNREIDENYLQRNFINIDCKVFN